MGFWDVAKRAGEDVMTGGLNEVDQAVAGKNLDESAGDAFNQFKEGQQSNSQFHGFDTSPNYNPDAFNFGGYAGGGQQWEGAALQGQQRADAMGQGLTNYGLSAQDRAVQENPFLADRYNQSIADVKGSVDLARQAAEGNAPSQAAYMMQRGLQNAQDTQNSQAAGARGAAAMANAQTNANANIANLQQGAFTQGGQLRAQEMAQARDQYGNLSAGLAGLQQGRLGQGNQMGQFNRQANDAFTNNMVNAGLGYANLGQGYFGQGVNIAGQQGQAQQAGQQMLNQGWNQGQQQQAGINLYNTNANRDIMNQVTGAGKSAGTGILGSVGNPPPAGGG